MNDTHINIILFGLFVFMLLMTGVVYAAFHLMASPRQSIQKRLKKLQTRFHDRSDPETKNNSNSIALNKEGSALDQFVKSVLPRPIALKKRLAQAGLKMGLGEFGAFSFIIFSGLSVLLKLALNLPLMLAFLIGLLAGLALPHYGLKRMIKKRKTQFTTLFPDAIDLIVRGLQSGLPVSDSIASVGREIADPVGVEFKRMSDSIRLGKPMDEAMWDTAERLDTADFKFFVISLSVQKETGGNLAETLSNLSKILRKRQQLKLKIRAMSSEGRASAMIVGMLPFIMLGLLMSINYDYASILFTDQRAIVVSIIGLIWMGFGVFIMSKMINFEI